MMNASRALRLTSLLILAAGVVTAQVPADREVLLNGEGAGQGKYGEANGYPGPRHVLDLADTLGLSAPQRSTVQGIFTEMAQRAKELGKQIVRMEEEINKAFAAGLVSETAVRNDCEELGRLRGRLRAVHLVAHLKCKAVLTDQQNALYRKLRSSPKP